MDEKSDLDVFMKNIPAFNVWYKALLTYMYHFLIFIACITFFWWISSKLWITALIIQFLFSSISNFPLLYVQKNFNKTRQKYIKKYKNYPWQKFWYHHSYTSPFGAAALYSPLLLKTDYFLPKIIYFPSNFFTNSIFPIYIAIPLSIFFVVFGILVIRSSQDKDRDMDLYLYIINPEKIRYVTDGVYSYVRHPRILSRLLISLGFGFFANNILAVLVALIHIIPYSIYMRSEDNELERRFGEEYKNYKNSIPYLFPRMRTFGKFIKFIFLGNK